MNMGPDEQVFHRTSNGDLIGMVPNRLSVECILQALSVDKSLVLFNTIASESTDTENLTNKLGCSRKQYYSKMSALLRAGPIKRQSKRGFLTSLGKIAYDAQLIIGKALGSYWKLAAIDSFEMSSSNPHLPVEEYNKIVDNLLGDNSGNKGIFGSKNNEDVAMTGNEKPTKNGV